MAGVVEGIFVGAVDEGPLEATDTVSVQTGAGIEGDRYGDKDITLFEAEAIEGWRLRPCFFQPTFQKHVGELCGGLQIHLTDREAFPSVLAGVAILRAIHGLYPDRFEWKQPPYEYVHDRLPFDVIAGTARLREDIVAGTPLEEIEGGWREGIEAFVERRRAALIY